MAYAQPKRVGVDGDFHRLTSNNEQTLHVLERAMEQVGLPKDKINEVVELVLRDLRYQ